MESKLERLSLQTPKTSASKEEVADSWEDGARSDSSSEDEHRQEETPPRKVTPAVDHEKLLSTPRVPPPTPVSPRTHTPDWDSRGGGDSREERRRPEKSTAVAGRLIAGALGVKAPKKTEEQRTYERSIKEQEIRRRSREKEQKEKERLEDEKAKASVWDA